MATGLKIRVRGQVQGVGFRPFIHRLAKDFQATGHVLNDAEGVLIFVACSDPDGFVAGVTDLAPPLSRIDAVEVEPADIEPSDGFTVAASGAAGAETRVTPDAATCADCVEEVFADGRRAGYAFTNCTNCGPRLTILRSLPYDRAQTTMAAFQMCPDCQSEYDNTDDRRFHAQPIACPVCGPQLAMIPEAADPLADAARRLIAGEIVAIKGLGGFHIACDATNADAVARLRQRKRRPGKPLALMGDLAMIKTHAEPTADDIAALSDPSAPIVLINRNDTLPETIAPAMRELGWMLPYTPLHHLLMARVQRPLVMTSGNLSGEPQVIGNAEAQERLAGIVDAWLVHNRDIARRLDDSVMRVTPHGPMILRRARGQVPGTLPLPEGFEEASDVVAYGAHLKSALCLTKNGQALLSHHLGDLDDPLTWEEFVKADADYADLFDHKPQGVACDLHPEYRSSRHAHATGIPVVEVQHHHAHLAACLAENGWSRTGGKVAGVILDGLGLGTDGTIWGGELLVGDYSNFERKAWLHPAPLPGGDAANREPWRNLLARLDRCGAGSAATQFLSDKPLEMIRSAIKAGVNAPLSSSAGRLFDAVAAAIGFEGAQSFEGEAAMRLEARARGASKDEFARPYMLSASSDDGALDDTPLWDALLEDLASDVSAETIALRFHAGLAQSFAQQAQRLIASGEANAVALSGGCFQNALLLDLTVRALGDVPVLHHTKVPANDGGLALGQALIAMAQLETG